MSGVEIARTTLSTFAEIKATSVLCFSLRDVYYTDLVSAATKRLVELDGVIGTVLDNLHVYSTNSCDLVYCSGTQSTRIDARALETTSGASGRCSWSASYLTVRTSNCDHVFNASSEEILFEQISGTTTWTNAVNIRAHVVSAGPPETTLTNNSATPSVAAGEFFVCSNSLATNLTNFSNPIAQDHRIVVRFTNANTTVKFGGSTTLYGNAGVDWVSASHSWLEAQWSPGLNAWLCAVHS
jgi:hypothetical protein